MNISSDPAINYEDTANQLMERILSLIPEHPEIMKMDSPWDLFKIEGLNYDDLAPSMAQADWAMQRAQQIYLEQNDVSR
jgi:hypothetical protein